MVDLGDPSGGRGPQRRWCFGEFRLDAAERTLHYGSRPVALREKAFELLTLLVSRAPCLVDKEVLRRQLWPQLNVHENNLAVTVGALRKALQGHDPHTSYFETVPKRGYRWICPLEGAELEGEPVGRSRAVGAAQDLPSAAQASASRPEPFIGRERELRWLLQRWESAESAAPVLALVGGEAGIGKTTLLHRFAAEVREQWPWASVAVGRCLELSRPTEPYLLWLEVLDALLSGPCAELWQRILGEQAPSWAARLSLAGPTLQQGEGCPAPGPFSLRELVQALAFAARERPLLLLLEDLHWADPSSVDVLRALDARPGLRGLLVVVSFRPVQARLQPTLASLLEELSARGRREELALLGWDPTQLEEYLVARFGGALGGSELARALWQQTEGLPFFATRLAEALMSSSQTGAGAAAPGPAAAARALVESLTASSVPGVAALLESQLRRVPEALQPSLRAACVAGPDLSTSVLARVLCQLPAELERQLDRLAFEYGLLERVGESEPVPGGVAVCYRFRHVLLQKHVYESLDSHERRALHLRTARALLAAGVWREPNELYHPAAGALDAVAASDSPTAGQQPCEASPAPSLALLRPARVAAHFGLGGQAASAVSFWTEAGDQAERAYAPREALSCYALAEELLAELPREQRELRRLFLRHGQGWAWFNLRDLSRAEQCFADIVRLAEELSGSDARCRELAHEYFTRPWSDELVRRTGNVLSPSSAAQVPVELRAEALRCQCQILALGERSEALRDRAERLLQLGQAAQSPARVAEGECFLALAALNTGEVERARQLLTGALAVARAGAYGRCQSLALHWLAELQLRQAELVSARELLLELLTQAPAAGDNAVALARLGDTLARLGELHEALRAHERAAALFERMEPPRPPLHGWLLRELGRAEEALQLDRAAVARVRPLADTHRLTRLLASLASTCCRVGLLDEAREALDEAESEVSREHQRSAARMHALWDARCALAIRRRDWQSVQELCERWLQVASAQRHVEGQMAAHRGLARAWLERGSLAAARSQAAAAIELSTERPIVLFDWRSHALLSEIARRSGDSQLAARALARARQLVHAIAERLEPSHRGSWLAAATAADMTALEP